MFSNRVLVRRLLGGARPWTGDWARAGQVAARELYTRLYAKLYHKLRTRNEMARLRAADDAVLNSLANALDAVLGRRISPEEQVWIDRIESLRNQLNASRAEISVVDYGAGTLDDQTAEQERQGRVETTTIGAVTWGASNRQMWALLLFKLIRELRPSVCLELGTGVGISAAYQAAALELNHHGRIVSLEGAPSLASIAQANIEKLGLGRAALRVGRFQDTLGELLREQGQIDFVFVDGHYKGHAFLAYFQQMSSHLSEDAVLLFNGIYWSKGMVRAWGTLTADPQIRASINLIQRGICVISGSREDKQSFKIALG